MGAGSRRAISLNRLSMRARARCCVFPFADAKEAMAYLETGRAKGKVVLALS